MCGIIGFIDTSKSSTSAQLKNQITHMSMTLHHRGPDDSGVWVHSKSGIAFGFRRLAILDLSPTGHQPMLSSDKRYVMIFNGEIYNFAELRAMLESLGHKFRGTSDTEIMLGAILEWGIEKAVQHFNGMFAIAIWDRQENQLHLVRDRLGIKPLYYGWIGKTFIFGSELKALRAHPDFSAEINRNALTLYLRHNYIPAPYTIYQGVQKLLPGNILTISANKPAKRSTTKQYWSVKSVVENGFAKPFNGSRKDAIDLLDSLLRDAVRLRKVADVPLGAFLSGGIDSSLIVALMQAQSSQPVRTFSIGFNEADYNEAIYAKEIAHHLGTKHTELYITPEQAQAVIPHLPTIYDEPFSDSSQIPTFLVSQFARQHVSVSISGDGGDELFGGYNRYTWAQHIWGAFGWMPYALRQQTAQALTATSGHNWPTKALPMHFNFPNINDKLLKLAEIISADTQEETYLRLISHWKQPQQIVIGGHEPETLLRRPDHWPPLSSFRQRMMYLDTMTYLPDDILVKLDRASMAVSLEARVPYLDDHRIIEFAWSLPLSMKIHAGQGKWVLRQVLNRYLPKQLIDRPKMGFGIPIDQWLRGPLREWAEMLLNEHRLQKEGFFHSAPIRQKWEEHISGQRNWQYDLWDVLMFQAWWQAQGKS